MTRCLESQVVLTEHQHLSLSLPQQREAPAPSSGTATPVGNGHLNSLAALGHKRARAEGVVGIPGCREQGALVTGQSGPRGRPLSPAGLGSLVYCAGTGFPGKWPRCCASGR